MSACLERLKKRKERIGWPVTTGTGIHGNGPGERLFLEGEVRVKVDLRSFHLLMTEPEGYDGEVYPVRQSSLYGKVNLARLSRVTRPISRPSRMAMSSGVIFCRVIFSRVHAQRSHQCRSAADLSGP
jgi:hypothetical protein